MEHRIEERRRQYLDLSRNYTGFQCGLKLTNWGNSKLGVQNSLLADRHNLELAIFDQDAGKIHSAQSN